MSRRTLSSWIPRVGQAVLDAERGFCSKHIIIIDAFNENHVDSMTPHDLIRYVGEIGLVRQAV